MKCPNCGKDFTSNFCPDCGYSPDINSSSENVQTPKEVLIDTGKEVLEHYTKKSFSKTIINSFFVFVVLIIVFSVIAKGCQGEKSKYMTSGDWADLSNYMFAVEIADFDGDIYEAGKYHFGIVGAALSREDTMIVWDIYVSNNCYKNERELKDYELVATIGGNTKIETDIELRQGQYVYINYNEVLGNPCGYVTIKKQ